MTMIESGFKAPHFKSFGLWGHSNWLHINMRSQQTPLLDDADPVWSRYQNLPGVWNRNEAKVGDTWGGVFYGTPLQQAFLEGLLFRYTQMNGSVGNSVQIKGIPNLSHRNDCV